MKASGAVYIGRFQPPHRAHLAVMLEGLELAERLLVVLGSARSARSAKNPFDDAERENMVRAALAEAGADPARLAFARVQDHPYFDGAWVREVRAAAAGLGAAPLLLGHEKDASSYYLRLFPGWRFVPTAVRSPLNATDLRAALFAGDWARFGEGVPPAVLAGVRAWAAGPHFARLAAEHAYLQTLRAEHAGCTHPPLFLAADALLTHAGRLLLVRRRGPLGAGTLALPGGLVDAGERCVDRAAFAAREEAGVAVSGAPRAQRLFDAPGRSLRGRTVTEVSHWELPGAVAPTPQPGGDAGAALWLPLAEALARPEAFFEDHHAILRAMLGQETLGANPPVLG